MLRETKRMPRTKQQIRCSGNGVLNAIMRISGDTYKTSLGFEPAATVCLLSARSLPASGSWSCCFLNRAPNKYFETCSDPPPKNHTIQNEPGVVHMEDSRYRYKCNEGYLRKAGTSSLIWCKRNNNLLQWYNVNGSKALVCIRSPKMVHARTTRATAHPTTIPATSTAATTTTPTTASKTTLISSTAPTTSTTSTTAWTTTTALKTTTTTASTTSTAPSTTTAPSPVMNWKSTVSQSSISPLPSKTTKSYYRPETSFTDVITNVKLHTPEPSLEPRNPPDIPGSRNGPFDPQKTSPSIAVQSTFIGSGAIAVIVLIAVVLLLWRRRRRNIPEPVIITEMRVLMNVAQPNHLEDE
ncbi:interleukin-15 receptor subunit alpha isoform X2 [Brienomyrus brachyistius]|uniref:interleukin-15 receptor subunit alpha isoform X2 n=1 Tax=Brienomyrus brachyistius TaxID=42636 RepID=UPI0020B35994|nr:interleukin-15 receptor subunit alpha isoform X2 [Brienomyrus brachyistius]